MKKFKQVLIMLIVILGLVMIISLVVGGNDLFGLSTKNSSEAALLQDNLVELSEWTTLKYEYTNVIISRSEKNLSLIGLPDVKLAEVIKLIQYSGYLKAGTDMSTIDITIDQGSNKLTAKVAKSKILDNVVMTETAVVEDIKGNIFIDYSPQIVFDEINEHKKQLEIDKVSQGFLKEADLRLTQLLIAFFKTKGYEDIEIIFF